MDEYTLRTARKRFVRLSPVEICLPTGSAFRLARCGSLDVRRGPSLPGAPSGGWRNHVITTQANVASRHQSVFNSVPVNTTHWRATHGLARTNTGIHPLRLPRVIQVGVSRLLRTSPNASHGSVLPARRVDRPESLKCSRCPASTAACVEAPAATWSDPAERAGVPERLRPLRSHTADVGWSSTPLRHDRRRRSSNSTRA